MMSSRLQQPDMGNLLTCYRNDFFVHDREILVDWGAPGFEYLWLVRESGTNLLRLGVHERPVEWFTAALEIANSHSKVFHATDRGVKEIARDKVADLLKQPYPFTVQQRLEGAEVLHRGVPIADLSIRIEPRLDASPLYHLAAASRITLGGHRISALREIVVSELSRRHGFWACIGSMTLDGAEFSDAMGAARLRESQPQLAAA